jgi:hypothetical protein
VVYRYATCESRAGFENRESTVINWTVYFCMQKLAKEEREVGLADVGC